jgi:hypothetical protein
MIAHRRDFVPLAHPGFQALFLHQSDHALAAHVLLLLEQILVNARAAPMLLPSNDARTSFARQIR